MTLILLWLLSGPAQLAVEFEGRQLPIELGAASEIPISIDDYVLNSGDTILVLVNGRYSYSYPTQITPTGQLMIMLPTSRRMTTFGLKMGEVSLVNLEVVGYAEIVDLPVKKARGVVAEAFSDFIRPVEVDFVLLGPRMCKINILGEVQWPGSYLVTPFMRVGDGIDQAGGLGSMGAASDIKLIRRSGDTLSVNLRRFLEDGDLQANPLLSDGDIIYIPKMQNFVLLRGAVFSKQILQASEIHMKSILDTLPAQVEMRQWLEFEPGEGVCDFIDRRAELVPQSDLENCYIERGSERIPFDMLAYLNSGNASNPKLKTGDIVTVPWAERFVYVSGEVDKPGRVVYNENMTINQYLGLAGGLLYTSETRAIRVLYPDGRTRRAHPDIPLEPGATIYVPRKPLYTMSTWVSLAAVTLSLVSSILSFGD
ncbi:SLBB domain-containing protein [candidate division WOR-3 bacterium]|nr:SLBB domain-containing protein [candidate division WOR-3 bacterium]